MIFKLFLLLMSVSACLAASDPQGQMISIQPQEAIKRVGDSLTVLYKVKYPIDSCRIIVGSTLYRLKPSENDPSDNVNYAGSGLMAGECGAHILHVTEDMNGYITCILPPQRGKIEIPATMKLIIAKQPKLPKLSLSDDMPKEGATVTANCEVAGGRPAAKISWFYDGKNLNTFLHKFTIVDNNAPKNKSENNNNNKEKGKANGIQKTVEQVTNDESKGASETVKWKASIDDDGKELKCVASHEGWDSSKTEFKKLAVRYKPILYALGKKLEEKGLLEFQCIKLGKPATITIKVRSFSAPTDVKWTIGKEILKPDDSSKGKFTANVAKNKHNKTSRITFFVYELTFKDVTDEVLNQKYSFNVTNSEGTVFKEFILSKTDPTPETWQAPAAEANFTAIVLGALSALGVLLLVATVVYARLKHRMCFARNPPTHTAQVVRPE